MNQVVDSNFNQRRKVCLWSRMSIFSSTFLM